MFTALTSLVGETTPGGALAHVPATVVAHGPWGDGTYWPFFLVFPLFWILVIFLFIFVGRRAWRRNHNWAARQGAEGVLRERYARGEIDETEFRQRLEVLRSQPSS